MTKRAPRIFILTGAGVSAESGLGTFRDVGGIWSQYRLEEVATPDAFERNPDLVYGFYNARRANLVAAAPNAAHAALAKLQSGLRAAGGDALIVTQNIDDLHERAGAQDIAHMHGELLKARCLRCGALADWRGAMDAASRYPNCDAAVRPHVVWFGEVPIGLDDIAETLAGCDAFVSIGTSGSVYPAAGFVSMAREMGMPATELNLEPSENAFVFTDQRYGPASSIVPAWVDDVLSTISGPAN
ncbi:MAG: NAD-dependent deacylase [Pseudomonadota bacterium]